ncbi:Ig-like domain-containing protein [Lachnoclostridium phytofermentans]|uniref:BIG2 domain-containing protein n=1 Tax=Lachnoclostridium phytofermentans (strain ATCC 700394 / DSM 18823 / ISDg) TaxID=357809 RepID=A9KQU2_LACP7|nr:Ig-like domain-containing protein [Lachnoclostridium phytofermentans]ABX43421.1 hypothetical protein Cphy_3064 [Lachnoclostridium phytofermentans ISDg]
MKDCKRKSYKIKGMLLILCCIVIGLICTTDVAEAAAKVTLNRSYVVTTRGATVQLKVSGTTNTVTWSSSDQKIAKVSKSGKVTKSLDVIVETGTGRLDPPDAIKQRNYIGYSDGDAGTLKKVAEVIDQYNLKSSDLSVEDKLRSIQAYFNETRKCNTTSNKTGNIANVMFNGHGNYFIQESRAYAETFALICDSLDIPNKYCLGGAYIPGENGYIPNF